MSGFYDLSQTNRGFARNRYWSPVKTGYFRHISPRQLSPLSGGPITIEILSVSTQIHEIHKMVNYDVTQIQQNITKRYYKCVMFFLTIFSQSSLSPWNSPDSSTCSFNSSTALFMCPESSSAGIPIACPILAIKSTGANKR